MEALPARPPPAVPAPARGEGARASVVRTDDLYHGAAAACRELRVPFHLAATRLERAQWLTRASHARERPVHLALLMIADSSALLACLGRRPELGHTGGTVEPPGDGRHRPRPGAVASCRGSPPANDRRAAAPPRPHARVGDDPPNVRDWVWPGTPVTSGRARSPAESR